MSNTNFKTRTSRRNGRNSTKSGNYVTKAQVKSLVQNMAQNQVERKYILNSLGSTTAMASVTSSGTIYPLTALAEGTGAQNRIGRNAVAKRIWGDLSFYADSTDILNTCRIIIFRWTDITAPTIGDVLQSSTNYVNSFYNLDYYRGPKLKILYDNKIAASYSGNGVALAKWDLKGHWPMQWNSSSANSAVVGGIFAVLVSDSTAVPSPGSAGAVAIEFDQ